MNRMDFRPILAPVLGLALCFTFTPRPGATARDAVVAHYTGRAVSITDDKGIRLKRTPKLGADDNRFEVKTEVTIAADGSTRAVRSEAYHNLGALNQRERWLEVPVGEQRRQTAAKLLDMSKPGIEKVVKEQRRTAGLTAVTIRGRTVKLTAAERAALAATLAEEKP